MTVSDVQTLDGSIEKPYSDIEDAVQKANEECAEVTSLCEVKIYLFKGDHYLLRMSRDYYIPTNIDNDS